MMRSQPTLGLLALLASAQASDDFTLRLPSQMPPWAQKLSPNLAAFSIEMDRWRDWAGQEVGKPNEYFNQLLKNLGERTGHMPFLRVGANSEDRATLDLSVPVMNATFPDPTPDVPNPEADAILIGRDFYALSANFPAGTPFHWGVNLKALNKSETVAQVQHLADTFQGKRADVTKHVKLMNVEIGNEPDLYDLGDTWDMYNYTDTWVEYAKAVSKVVDLGSPDSDKPTLSPGSYAGSLWDWSTDGTLAAGILDDRDLLSKTGQFAGHGYSGVFDDKLHTMTGELMDKSTIRSNLSKAVEGVPSTRAMGLDFVLSETNSYANHGYPDLSNTVESAIWAVQWILSSAAAGVKRVHFHHGRGFRYNILQPISKSDDGLNISHPHILPAYHSYLIINEAIGTSGSSSVAELQTTNENMTAYGVWEDSKLARVVILNSEVYVGGGDKPSTEVRLDGLSSKDASVEMRLLRSDKTTSHTGLTWAGQSFETRSGKPSGKVQTDEVKGGSFQLPASSIALLSFGGN